MKKLMLIIVLVVLVGGSSCSNYKIRFFPGKYQEDTVNIYPVYTGISSTKYVGEFVESHFPLRTGNNWTYKVVEYTDAERNEAVFDVSDSLTTFRIEVGALTNLSDYDSSLKKTLQGYKVLNRSNVNSFYVKHDSCISLLKIDTNSTFGYILINDYKTYGKEYKGCRYLGNKEVTVPAGTFNTRVFAVKYWFEINLTIYYFTENVGWVKFDLYDWDGNIQNTYELIEYNLVDD